MSLAPESKTILKGERKVYLRKDQNIKIKSKAILKDKTKFNFKDDRSREIFESLRKKRFELAKEQNIPPYLIFHDKTLLDIAETRPSNLDEFSNISGVGISKLDKYGSIFLDLLRSI